MNLESHNTAEHSGAWPGDSLIERERAVLREVSELLAYRVGMETRIRSEYQATLKAAERDREDSGATLISRGTNETLAETRLYEQTRQTRVAQFETAYSAAESQFSTIKMEATRKFEVEKRRAKKRRDEA